MSQRERRRVGWRDAIDPGRSDASVLEPLIEFAVREAAAGRVSSPITPLGHDEAVSMPGTFTADRWGPRDLRWIDGRYKVVVRSPAKRPAFERDVAALMASRHEERRRVSKVTGEPLPKQGETLELSLDGWGWLYKVDGYGRRLVCAARVRPGVYLVWDMSDYNRRDAIYLAKAFVGGYLGPHEPWEALENRREPAPRRYADYQVPCIRRDHADGDWSQAVMPWSGTLLRPREPVLVMLEHQDRVLAQWPGLLTPDTIVEAVGLSWDTTVAGSALNPGSWATYLFFVRTGPYAGTCVSSAPEPQKRGLPDGFDEVAV